MKSLNSVPQMLAAPPSLAPSAKTALGFGNDIDDTVCTNRSYSPQFSYYVYSVYYLRIIILISRQSTEAK